VAVLDVAIALGSNLPPAPSVPGAGEPRARALLFALDELEREGCRLLARSSWIETLPVDVPDAQPPYLNGCALLETPPDLGALLALTRAIERRAGRTGKGDRAARSLDLDLVAAWQVAPATGRLAPLGPLALPGLEIPHPRAGERRFVLGPLAQIAGERPWPRPVGALAQPTVADLLARLAP
jgi:2-amino-4-hydroxy-6-hydroxymethyldihydropteridine diphosphokinase